jgi:hypothetical protein
LEQPTVAVRVAERGRGAVVALADDDRGLRTGRGQLRQPEVLTGDVVDVLGKPTLLSRLGPIDLGDGHHHDLQLHVDHLNSFAAWCPRVGRRTGTKGCDVSAGHRQPQPGSGLLLRHDDNVHQRRMDYQPDVTGSPVAHGLDLTFGATGL